MRSSFNPQTRTPRGVLVCGLKELRREDADQQGNNVLLTQNDVAARVNKIAVKGFLTPVQVAAVGWDDDNDDAADKLRQLPATLASLRDIWQRIRAYGAAQGWAAYPNAVHGGQIQSHVDAILAVSQG